MFLRRAFEIFYLQCDLVEQLVLDVFGAELSGQDIVAPEAGPRGLVEQIVIKLAMLSLLCFPNETKDDVPDLVVSAGTIFVGTGRKMQFPGGACRVQTRITVRKGYTFRMPFWVPELVPGTPSWPTAAARSRRIPEIRRGCAVPLQPAASASSTARASTRCRPPCSIDCLGASSSWASTESQTKSPEVDDRSAW